MCLWGLTNITDDADRESTQQKPTQKENGEEKVVEFGASETTQAVSVVDSTSSVDNPQAGDETSAFVIVEVDHVLSQQTAAVVDQGHNPLHC